jgi:hypothetical protein
MRSWILKIIGLSLRLLLLLAGLVFTASLLCAAVVVLGVWLLRALWAKLSGRPVQAWTFRLRRQAPWQRPPTGRAAKPASDVIDVQPRELP